MSYFEISLAPQYFSESVVFKETMSFFSDHICSHSFIIGKPNLCSESYSFKREKYQIKVDSYIFKY